MDGRSGVDPREVLGVPPGASPDELTAAFRRLAKQWHPDAGRTQAGDDRMALINAAYAALTRGAVAAGVAATAPPSARGDGLAPALRRALGRELRQALEAGEAVGLVVPTATWASPQTVLAVTDRRLLWLLDDAPVHRVRELRLRDLREARVRGPRPWRRRAQVVLEDRRGRRTSFGELAPETAAAIVRRAALDPQPTDDRPAD
ncbi:J domain-containing protein [Patulibacter defluvii]|uniref:J domain-containing protein n=1 Tax=Patulibacter defluvii TaxID=3095358 RepID=UPI002A75DDF0|nr:J domain-containing protein [Patulibacter sp. DM4]